MSTTAVGLEIGSDAVRAAVVDSGKSSAVLRRFAEMPLPAGVVVAGEIIEPAPVSEALAALWKRAGLPRKGVVAGVANQRVIVRTIDIPQLDENEIVEALPYLAQDAIPIPVEDAVLDYVPLEEFTSEEGDPQVTILVVAAHREMIDGVVEVTGKAGLKLSAIDLQPFALVRATFGSTLLDGNGGSQALLDIGGSLTQIVIVRDGVVRFVRILPSGGHDFTQSLVEDLSIDTEEAAELKKEVGVQPNGVVEGGSEHVQAALALTRTADLLIDEVRGSINYYLGQSGEASLDRLIVAGNGARLPHLANRIARALGTDVEPARALDHISVGRLKMTESELLTFQPVLPPAVGLGLWGRFVIAPTQRFNYE